MNAVDTRLAELGITLPTPAAPIANYVPYVITGNLLVISGQLCFGLDGKLSDAHKGKLGAEIFNEAGLEAARLCAINVLAQAKAALNGDLSRITRCVRLGGFINVAPHFAALPAIMSRTWRPALPGIRASRERSRYGPGPRTTHRRRRM